MKSWLPLVALTLINAALVLSQSTSAEVPTPAVQPVVRARLFELVTESGDVRGQIFLDDDGCGNLRFRDHTGTVRIKLGCSAKGSSGLLLMDEKADPAINLGYRDGSPKLTLSEDGKEARVLEP